MHGRCGKGGTLGWLLRNLGGEHVDLSIWQDIHKVFGQISLSVRAALRVETHHMLLI